MEISTIALVLCVARLKSFADAARAHDLDPSSVSRTVAQVERRLGARLFQRTTRRIALTEAGETFVARMTPIVEEYARAVDTVQSGATQVEGVVRLTASVAFGQMKLTPMLRAFETALPGVRIELILTDDTVDLVDQKIDLAVRLGPKVSGDVVCSKLCATRYRVCASPDYVEAAGPLKRPRDLMTRDALLFGLEEFRTRWLFRSRVGRVSEVPVQGRFMITSVLALRAAALDGMGPALLADWLIDDDLKGGRLVDLFPHYEVTATTFETAAWIVYPSRAFLPRRVRAVIDVLRGTLSTRPLSN